MVEEVIPGVAAVPGTHEVVEEVPELSTRIAPTVKNTSAAGSTPTFPMIVVSGMRSTMLSRKVDLRRNGHQVQGQAQVFL